MPGRIHECDVSVVVGLIVVFALPLTLLIPGFSVWDVIPKVRVTRYHAVSQVLTWAQLNAGVISLLALFFCLYLEIRKRMLDDMVDKVLTMSQVTDDTMKEEHGRQTAAMRVCVEVLDATAEHYENLTFLRDELRKRDNTRRQYPPVIERSTSEMCQ